jgi:hypothetical protein
MKFIWPESARAELRAIDREFAIRILRARTEYGESGVGDYRVIFTITPDEITIVRARHRSDICR